MPPKNAGSGMKEYTVVVSGDGFEYVCQKDVLMDGSKMFKGMLESGSPFLEARENRVTLPGSSGLVVQFAVLYLYYRDRYKYDEAVPNMDVPKHILLLLLELADYMKC